MKYSDRLLDRAWIMAHIPHQGRMCLLDEVTRWDAERISCRSSNHRDIDHPLRAHDRLGILCGVEYAAQAMAVHGALVSGALAERGAGEPATDAATTPTTTTITVPAFPSTSQSTSTSESASANASAPGSASSAGFASVAESVPGPASSAGSASAPAQAVGSARAAGSGPATRIPRAGFLAALRGVTAHVPRLDDVPGDLIVTASQIAGDRTSALYEFEVRSAVACLLSGRATVVLDAKGRLQS